MAPGALNGPSLLLLLVAAAHATEESVCSADGAASFRFSVTSRRNHTGHRIVLVDLQNEAIISSETSSGIAMGVTHGRSLCENRERVHLATVIAAFESDPNPRQRRADYKLFPGLGYYKLHTTGKSWEDARVSCISEQVHLMVINSDAEAGVVKDFFSRNPTLQGVSDSLYMYIGYHDRFAEGKFITVTGEPLTSTGYLRWGPGQPDGGLIQNFGGVDKNGLLHDINDSMNHAFICEQDL